MCFAKQKNKFNKGNVTDSNGRKGRMDEEIPLAVCIDSGQDGCASFQNQNHKDPAAQQGQLNFKKMIEYCRSPQIIN